MYSHPFFAHAGHFHAFFLIFLLIGLVLQIVFVVIPAFMILKKMGYSGWWSLITYLPLGKTIGLWILATAAGPVERRATASESGPT
jgi:RsiW-degrading membrane proteinase PrsW (M82 family)